ncbi:YqaJ viral recombinase family nuclease [Oceanirhabdus sp. W0125-5]|uniref:YqaJ viral recombinase family nuclease n=1 Tax=Oceanirhabdus sp. W0125-5 TaxID=2999116 RepID=UPI0022F2B96D|nr:YqaJ viral recombinase family protein [Oceanirhabdus sp. W0125-5]WBW95279.1 YqaJ viral recombinase family protein [Oceanirhabdus sp. W0125-5]
MNFKILSKTNGVSREEWLELRKKGLGGSDVGAICGLNKWKSPISVYLDKVGELPNEDIESEAAYWGTVMEDTVAKEFEKRTGKKVRRKNFILQHKEYPWMLANLDRVIVGENALLECKTASAYKDGEWKDDVIPESYLLQVQHYLAVTGCEKGYIATLIGGNKFVWKEIQRDQEIIEYLINIEKDFWENHIKIKNPPVIDGSEASTQVLKMMYPEAIDTEEILLDYEAAELIEKRNKLKAEESKLKGEIAECENKIKVMIGAHEKATVDTYKISWKNVNSNRLDSKNLKIDHPDIYEKYCKTSISRRFSIKEVS